MSGSPDASSLEDARARAISIEKSSVLDAMTPHLFRTLRREPALAITVGYLFVAMAGIFYNYTFYERFGIPVLTLSQVGDFLVAGIQNPMAILLVASTLPLVWLFDRMNLRRRRRRVAAREEILRSGTPLTRWQRIRVWALLSPPRWVTGASFILLIVIYGWMFVRVYARHQAENVETGDAQSVTVWLNGQAEPLPASQSKTWTYLGATSNYLFVYDPGTRRAQILPVNNVVRVQPMTTRAPDKQSGVIVAPIP